MPVSLSGYAFIINKQLETNAAVQRRNRPIYKCLCRPSLHLYKTF